MRQYYIILIYINIKLTLY